MPLHLAAWNAGLEGAGAPYRLEEEDFYAWGGIHEAVIVGTLNERHGAEVNPEQVIQAKAEAFELGMSELQPILPVSGFAQSMEGRAKLGVVSGSPKKHVFECLELTGIRHLFESIVTPEDVEPGRGKPHPDMFLLQASELEVAPRECLVFEDGQSGIDGARAAGMATVFVPRDCR